MQFWAWIYTTLLLVLIVLVLVVLGVYQHISEHPLSLVKCVLQAPSLFSANLALTKIDIFG